MNRRTVIVSATVLTCLGLTASSAGAVTTPSQSAGSAVSSVSLLTLDAGGHSLRMGDVSLVTDTLDAMVSSIVLTPVTADGTAYGTRTVTPASSPLSVPATSTPGALAPYASVTSPAFSASATTEPSTQVGTTSLGSVSLLGLPIQIGGRLSVGSSVGPSVGALAGKSVTVQNVSLPSIAEVLGALGIDLDAIGAPTLATLLDQLALVTGAVQTAQAAVDAAQIAVNSATATLASRTAELAADSTALTAAQDALETATTAVQASLTEAAFGGTISDYAALTPLLQSALAELAPSLPADYATFTSAQSAVAAAQSAVTAAQALVDQVQAQLVGLDSTLAAAVRNLTSAIIGVLDNTPLLKLGSLELSTIAQARTAAQDGQTAKIVGGTLSGLEVLGTDVLQAALNTSSVDLGTFGSTAAAAVNSTIATVTGTLSAVLSSVPGMPTLEVPAPQISLLTKQTSTSAAQGVGRAEAIVTGLSITIPPVTVPVAAALLDAASLPAFAGVNQSGSTLVTAPVRLGLLTLRDQSLFRPAAVTVTTAPTTTPPTSAAPTGRVLADTGLPAGAGLLALTVLTAGLVLRRRRLATA